MKQRAEGRIHERITAVGVPRTPIYAVLGDESHLLIDAGVNLLGPRYLASINELLPDTRRLGRLFLTHSHWGHVGVGGLSQAAPSRFKLGADERVAALARRPSALATMNRLSTDEAELFKYNPAGEDSTLHPFELDIILKQGDEFRPGGLTCRVYETPGHTRDSLAYFFPEIKTLFPGEACGVLGEGPGTAVYAAFLASFRQYVESLEFLTALEPEIVCLTHNWVLTGDDVAEFFKRSRAEVPVWELIQNAWMPRKATWRKPSGRLRGPTMTAIAPTVNHPHPT